MSEFGDEIFGDDLFIFASSRKNMILTGDGNDTIWANGGRDTIHSGAGDDLIRGGRRADKIYAGDGNDVLYGGRGRDKLFGGSGDDILVGGRGRDKLYGGEGFDIALYQGGLDDYKLTFTNDGKVIVKSTGTVVDRGIDVLHGVEAIYFKQQDYLYYIDGQQNKPDLVDDTFGIYADQPLRIVFDDFKSNDFNPSNMTFTFENFSSISDRGIAITVQDGIINYDPNGAFDTLFDGGVIQDWFTYQMVSDTGVTYDLRVTVSITGVNAPPVIIAPDALDMWENMTLVSRIDVSDPEFKPVTVKILDQGDGALFTYDADRGQLNFVTAPDFEAPLDDNGDNIYHASLLATDPSGGTANHDITITIKDSAEIDTRPRINEIHYDDTGLDDNEMIEVRVSNGYDVSQMSLYLYNGKPGLQNMYSVIPMTSINVQLISSDTAFDYYLWDAPMSGLQNGADGIALVEAGSVIEFISYEGSFIALDGPALGMQAVDIGVFETNDGSATQSLQRLGDGTWIGPLEATPGYENQTGVDAELGWG